MYKTVVILKNIVCFCKVLNGGEKKKVKWGFLRCIPQTVPKDTTTLTFDVY